MKHNTESNTLDHSNLINKLDNFRNAYSIIKLPSLKK